MLFSMLSSTFLELVDATFSLRGRHLRNTLENMLGDHSTEFFKHPIFRQLAYAANNKHRISPNALPGWINKNTFGAIVMDILNAKDGNQLHTQISSMEDGELKRLMFFLLRQSNGDVDVFKQNVEHWFDEIMARATDWYKRNTKFWLFLIGFGLAGVFNADTIRIYQSLSANAAARDRLTELAESFAANRDSVPTLQFGKKSPEQAKAEFVAIQKTYTQIVQSPLGLGWDEEDGGGGLPWWLVKLAGLILTGLAVTLGAQFWFDALKKVISLKGGTVSTIATTLTKTASSISTTTEAKVETTETAAPEPPKVVKKVNPVFVQPKTMEEDAPKFPSQEAEG
jgi:hypothetical protein